MIKRYSGFADMKSVGLMPPTDSRTYDLARSHSAIPRYGGAASPIASYQGSNSQPRRPGQMYKSMAMEPKALYRALTGRREEEMTRYTAMSANRYEH